MGKVIVTTSIHPVTEAIRRFQSLKDWELVVVGDKKTPLDYQLTNGTYVTPEMQDKYDRELSEAIGWNSIQRRNFGFLWAHDMGADVVALVDDDNIPYEGWGENLSVGRATDVYFYETDLPAFEPLGATNEKRLWHRGYPLELVSKREYSRKTSKTVDVDVQADMWNGDPDVDAVCRLEHAPDCSFDEGCFPLASNKMSPFNSQNTFIKGSLLRDYFVFPFVGRMDDIWASYYVQAKGARVVYGKASVYQARNPHDLMHDMRNEYIGYENNLALVEDLQVDSERITKYLPEESWKAFKLYQRHFT